MSRTRNILTALVITASGIFIYAAPSPADTTPVAQTTVTVTLQANGHYRSTLYRGTEQQAEFLTGPNDVVAVPAPTPDKTGHGLTETMTITPHGGEHLTAAQVNTEQQAFLHPESAAVQRAAAPGQRAVKSRTVTLTNHHGTFRFTPGKFITAVRVTPVVTSVPTTKAMSSWGSIPTSSGCETYAAHSTLGACYLRNALGSDTYYNYSFDQSQASGHGANGWWLSVAALRHIYNADHHNAVIKWAPGADSPGGNCSTVNYSLSYLGAGASVSSEKCSDGFDMLWQESYFRNEWYGGSTSNTIGVPAVDLIKVRKGYNSGYTFGLTQRVCEGLVPSFCQWEDKYS